jgi:hypothetical protein
MVSDKARGSIVAVGSKGLGCSESWICGEEDLIERGDRSFILARGKALTPPVVLDKGSYRWRIPCRRYDTAVRTDEVSGQAERTDEVMHARGTGHGLEIGTWPTMGRQLRLKLDLTSPNKRIVTNLKCTIIAIQRSSSLQRCSHCTCESNGEQT